MKRSIVFVLTLITLNLQAQINWGVVAGAEHSKVIKQLISGYQGFGEAELAPSIGAKGGVFVDTQFKNLLLGIETNVNYNRYKYIEHPELAKFNVVYLTCKPTLGFSPLKGLWLEVMPAINFTLLNEHVDKDWQTLNLYYFSGTAQVTYRYDIYSIGLGYSRPFTTYGGTTSGSTTWEYLYRKFELTFGLRLGSFRMKKE